MKPKVLDRGVKCRQIGCDSPGVNVLLVDVLWKRDNS